MAKNKSKDKANPNIVKLWPTTILVKRFAHYQKVNPVLIELFYKHRDKENRAPGQAYASRDDLLHQYPLHKELGELAEFIREGIFEVAKEANQQEWGESGNISVNITGLWFQIANGHAFHETHVHGNCSWSGVYYVQAGDASASRESHKGHQPNGNTRFYGPNMEYMAGGHGDYGNLYLHNSSWDSYAQDGKVAIFPSHIKHMAFPYNGESDRVIVSFHAQVFNSNNKGQSYDYSMSN